jgi:hypothetical protein
MGHDQDILIVVAGICMMLGFLLSVSTGLIYAFKYRNPENELETHLVGKMGLYIFSSGLLFIAISIGLLIIQVFIL